MTSTADYALVAAAGLAGGFVNAAAGGGSLILYPALVGIGLPSVDANVTNSVGLWPGYVGNVLGLRRQIAETRSVLRRLAAASIGGALVGAALLLSTPSGAFDVIVPFLVILASLLLALQPTLKRVLNDTTAERPRVLLMTVLLGSVYGGYFGGGLGVILLAVLGLTLGSGIRVANAVKSALAFLVNTVSVAVFLASGHVHWHIALAVAPAALAGGVLGARLTTRINERWLRRLVVTFGFAIGIWLAVKAFG